MVESAEPSAEWQFITSEWRFITSRHDGYHLITSANADLCLSCFNDKLRLVQPVQDDDVLWRLEFQTGELCFLSAVKASVQLRCSSYGCISPTNKRRGWEGWRLIEAGGGDVLINSWVHKLFFLCSTEGGFVSTTQSVLSISKMEF
eukprot:GHVN01089142.1.p1 GENE.GHVN01089142.1~~GHVN01089142.1.p1  ORF type:complete len:146 (+),score=24.88 GHVN01089142.1:170-607(+)